MEFKEHVCDQHLFACLFSVAMAESIVKSLPNGDLTDELEEILNKNFEILTTYMEGKHYGSKMLDEYIEYLAELKRNFKGGEECH